MFRLLECELWYGLLWVVSARAIADYVLTLSRIDDVRALVAFVVRKGLCTLLELTAELEEGLRNGSCLLRQAIGEVSGGAASAPEARAARILCVAGVVFFEQNVCIELFNGCHYVVDFYWFELWVIFEIDSVEYYFDVVDWCVIMDCYLMFIIFGYLFIHCLLLVLK